MNPDGSGQRSLTRHLGLDGLPAWSLPVWSPDGQRIAFAEGREFSLDLYVMNADGSEKRLLARNAFGPVWSPDGRTIAFVSGHPGFKIKLALVKAHGRPGDVYVANADGSGQRRLTHGAHANAPPAWSPDDARSSSIARGDRARGRRGSGTSPSSTS